MCKVKTGVAVTRYEDLQNLVAGTVLRQEGPFKWEDVNCEVLEQLKGSPFEKNEGLVPQLCRDTITCLKLSGCLRNTSIKGYYRLTAAFPPLNPASILV